MKRIVTFTFIIISTLALAFLVYEFRQAVFLLLFALILASALRPPILWLVKRKLPNGLAILLVYVAFVIALAGLLVLITPGILTEFGQVISDLAVTYDRMWESWPSGSNLERLLIQQLPPPDTFLSSITGDQVLALLSTFAGITASSLTTLGEFAVVIVLSVYWSIYRTYFERLWLSRLNPANRRTVRNVWQSIESTLGSYIRSELLQSLLAGCILYLTFWLFGMPYPLILAVLGAVAWLIPYIGVIFAIVSVFLVGSMVSLTTAILTAVITLSTLISLQLGVEPLLFRRKDFSPLLTVLMMILLADSFGLLGLLIAPPVAAAIQIVLRNTLIRKEEPADNPASLEMLKSRLSNARASLANQASPAAAQLLVVAERLDQSIHALEIITVSCDDDETSRV